MRIAVLQHVHYEHLPGLDIGDTRLSLAFHRADQDDLPQDDTYDGLCVLGGPCNVDDRRQPWLQQERRLIARARVAGKPILAICMGAQQLTRVLGAAVVRNPVSEIGWFPLRLTDAGRRSPLRHFEGIEVLHWHDDACTLPTGAILLADSTHCPVQAYTIGTRQLALQFHAEWTRDTVEALIADVGLPPESPSIHSAERLRTSDSTAMNRAFSQLFNEFFAPVLN